MVKRIITGLILTVLALPLLLYGNIALRILIPIIATLMCYELVHLHPDFKKYHILSKVCIFSIILIFPYIISILGDIYALNFWWFGLMILLFMVLSIFDSKLPVSATLLNIFILIIVNLSFITFYYLLQWDVHYIVLLGFATFGCDVGAYFFGYFFGKHKLAPVISPKKTWEGSIGGYFTGMILAFLYAIFFFSSISYFHLALICIVIPFIAQLGDLAFSSFKREYHIKDYGSILPGHGGILDRIDSFIFSIITFAIIGGLL